MRRLRLLGLAGFAVLFLSACGQKGPLHMPDEEPQQQALQLPDEPLCSIEVVA
ncbi:LPS translocon maturation chaperone LptM [Kangiella sediminilitoris]|uniref:LPS translocon maturation chaperone LptM n=1 Tax=Kangiella sediminilitoris TaxID=1144748 RepID=UPI000B0783F1|nr:lipoprotein [Kangiella sediminilitoris]